ncbi:MucBP domain-containing protein [Weissella kandleri]|uniref:MucBP domain-containing protein n=1 Tax=Weissella kandleri TaxID=1616 RepID=UPI00387E2183
MGTNIYLFYGDENLPEIKVTNMYTGKWQNVGNGTVDHPTGKNIWSSSELINNYRGLDDADTYVWQKNEAADVTVRYVDENGKAIAKSEVKSGNVGDRYTTEKKDITGYTFKEVQGSSNGEFTDKAQTVTYIYTKNDDNVKPSDPSQPAKPDTPDHSGDNNSNTSEQPGNNSTGNDVMTNVVEGVQSVLTKTAAEKVTLAGIVSVVLASLVGLIVWKKRK